MLDFVEWLIARARRRPYFHLCRPNGDLYMRRWWLLGHGTDRDRDPDGRMCNPWVGGFARWWAANLYVIRVHQIVRSDKDPDLHDHPAWNVSVVLRGGYWELVPDLLGSKFPFDTLLPDDPRRPEEAEERVNERCIRRWRPPGTLVFRGAHTRHKIVLPRGRQAWSLFAVGKKSNEWGFYVRGVKVHWRVYESQHGKRVESWQR